MERKNAYKLREKIFKRLFVLTDYLKIIIAGLNGLSNFIFSVSTIFFIVLFFFHIGFFETNLYNFDIIETYKITFLAIFISKFILEIIQLKKRKIHIWIFDGIVFLFGLGVLYFNFREGIQENEYNSIFIGKAPIIVISVTLILTELNKLLGVINSLNIPPALLFVLSFLLIIIIGSGLLMLPKAHIHPISFLDALFTSTSAVCVTGLIVVDTATAFTTLGKIIIISLIQIGGLGIMTFTGFFSYMFTGSASFRERMLLRDILSSENLGNLFKILSKILLITFLTELIGALIIYVNLSGNFESKFFFSIFHSISAFCNAGFSTMSEGLYTAPIRMNYNIHIMIAILIILGGIGFPVLLQLYKYIKHFFVSIIRRLKHQKTIYIRGNDLNTSIVITTTVLLLVAGMIGYYLLEKDTSLKNMSNFQQVIVTFFGSVSARTAGFNVADISRWSYPTIFFMIFLMWVGASPGSTGGGIKTTTFAVALRATFSFVRGKKHLEIKNREIGSATLSRVLVIIILSIVVIFAGFMALLIFNPDKNPVHLLFESFSAFGTVGLSLVNTGTLTENSKWVIIFLMFIGRVGPLTLLSGILVSYHKQYYKYPVQDVIIN
ncbi:MAG TPA: ATPase [Bacteroidales bacterium]|jgi:potassium uptake TrkH family protein|nr:ATPase [Bacteroidales bacterium]